MSKELLPGRKSRAALNVQKFVIVPRANKLGCVHQCLAPEAELFYQNRKTRKKKAWDGVTVVTFSSANQLIKLILSVEIVAWKMRPKNRVVPALLPSSQGRGVLL